MLSILLVRGERSPMNYLGAETPNRKDGIHHEVLCLVLQRHLE